MQLMMIFFGVPLQISKCQLFVYIFQDEPMPSTSRGAGALPIRRPMPRMAAFAVPSTSRAPDEPPLAKRKQIETRQRQLDSLKKMEDRYKNLQREEVKAKEPKLVIFTPFCIKTYILRYIL